MADLPGQAAQRHPQVPRGQAEGSTEPFEQGKQARSEVFYREGTEPPVAVEPNAAGENVADSIYSAAAGAGKATYDTTAEAANWTAETAGKTVDLTVDSAKRVGTTVLDAGGQAGRTAVDVTKNAANLVTGSVADLGGRLFGGGSKKQ